MLSDALARSKRNTAVCRAMIRAANAFNDFRFRGIGDMGRTHRCLDPVVNDPKPTCDLAKQSRVVA